MKPNVWGAIGGGFLVSCIIATAIDQSFQGFGFEICNSLPDTGDVLRICKASVREQTSSGFTPMAIFLWIAFTGVILGVQDRKN
jgi:hypothetical protein